MLLKSEPESGDSVCRCRLTHMVFGWAEIALAPLVIVAAYIVLAVGGFGSALISIPLLALLLPVKLVVPVVLLVDLTATLATGMRFRQDVAWAEIKPIIPTMLIGLIAGVTLLVKLPARWVLTSLGLFILGYGLYSLVYHERTRMHSRWWSIPTGVVGGVISGLFGMGGPVYVMYLAGRIVDPSRLRATLSAIFSTNTAARLGLFLFSGLLVQKQVWTTAACLLPFMALGLFIGHRLHLRLNRSQIGRLISLLLLATGAGVLWKAASSG
jgi:uncharacterized membrane protein YfcA